METYLDWMRAAYFITVTGCPAISVPVRPHRRGPARRHPDRRRARARPIPARGRRGVRGCCRRDAAPGGAAVRSSTGAVETCGIGPATLWTESHGSVEQSDQFRWNRRNVGESPCAPDSAGHRTSLTPSGNGRRDSSETRVHTIANRLAGEGSRRLGDEAAGTGDDERVDRKRHRYRSTEGPLRLILARALRLFPEVSGRWVIRRPPIGNPAQLWGSGRFLWTTGVTSVDEAVIFGGTRRMLPKALAHPVREGIELLSRPPATGGGTARRRRSTRERTGLPGRDRGGEMTTTPGPEEKSSRSGASSVPVNRRALGTHTLEGPSPISGRPLRDIRNRLTRQ